MTAVANRPAQDGEAEIGERVTVLDLTTSAVHDHRLIEAEGERVVDGDVSIYAPLGSALLGRHVGDVVSVEDEGQIIRLEVVEIDG
jgi:transcription elongation GreA/GreB family factor